MSNNKNLSDDRLARAFASNTHFTVFVFLIIIYLLARGLCEIYSATRSRFLFHNFGLASKPTTKKQIKKHKIASFLQMHPNLVWSCYLGAWTRMPHWYSLKEVLSFQYIQYLFFRSRTKISGSKWWVYENLHLSTRKHHRNFIESRRDSTKTYWSFVCTYLPIYKNQRSQQFRSIRKKEFRIHKIPLETTRQVIIIPTEYL